MSNVSFEIQTSDNYNKEDDNEGVIMTIYGEEGAGKTTALANLPVDKTLVIGFDTGTKVLKRMKAGHRIVQIKKDLSNIDAVISMIDTEDEKSDAYKVKKDMFPNGIKFIVIDHITQFFEFITNAFADKRGHFIRTLKDAGDANAAMKKYINIFTTFAYEGINIIFLALEHSYEVGKTRGEDPRPIEKVMPYIGGRPPIPKLVCGISDVVGRFTYDPTNDTRAIRLYGAVEEKFACKTRFRDESLKHPHEEWEVPDIFHLLCKAHDIDPEKAVNKVLQTNEEERARLKEIKGQRATVKVDLKKSSKTNTVTGTTNESSKKAS